jgi:hypothetical protein
MLHGPETNEGSCSTETSFAMDGDSAMVWLLEVLVHHLEEISYDFVWGCGSINEEKILMRDTSVLKVLLIIFLLI